MEIIGADPPLEYRCPLGFLTKWSCVVNLDASKFYDSTQTIFDNDIKLRWMC